MQVAPDRKLPLLYLLDSIVKNIGGVYLQLFSRNLVTTFRSAYENVVDEATRSAMLRLLDTWDPLFPQKTKIIRDRLRVSRNTTQHGRSIHVNPRVLSMRSQGPVERATSRVDEILAQNHHQLAETTHHRNSTTAVQVSSLFFYHA